MNIQQHTISLYMHNRPGTLIRIASVFSRRSYNINSLVVSESRNPLFSIMTIVATGDEKGLTNVIKQLNKLIDVVHAVDHTHSDALQRELALVKIRLAPEKKSEILQLIHTLQCTIIDINLQEVILEISGDVQYIDQLSGMLSEYEVIEFMRTGKVLIARSAERTALLKENKTGTI